MNWIIVSVGIELPWAKYADALRSTSLACFNSRTSRSKAFIFSVCSVVTPPHWQVSTSICLTHSFSVCGAQQSFEAIDTIAAQWLSCCPAPSNTIRKAHLRTSGEYLFVVFVMMLHPTQELAPPANPERFSSLRPSEAAKHCGHLSVKPTSDSPNQPLLVSLAARVQLPRSRHRQETCCFKITYC